MDQWKDQDAVTIARVTIAAALVLCALLLLQMSYIAAEYLERRPALWGFWHPDWFGAVGLIGAVACIRWAGDLARSAIRQHRRPPWPPDRLGTNGEGRQP